MRDVSKMGCTCRVSKLSSFIKVCNLPFPICIAALSDRLSIVTLNLYVSGLSIFRESKNLLARAKSFWSGFSCPVVICAKALTEEASERAASGGRMGLGSLSSMAI